MIKRGNRAMRCFVYLTCLQFFLASGIANGAEKSLRAVPVRIAIVSKSTLDLPFWVAQQKGFFRDEGLDLEIVFMRSNLTLQALAAGAIDFGSATGAAINAIVGGVDLRVVYAMSERPMFDVVSHPSITTIAQLRGKRFGFGGIGSLSENIMRQILAVHQLSFDQVKFINLGQNSLTYVALKNGTIDATTLQVPQTFFAQDEGFRKLAATADYYHVVQGGLTTTKATLNERPEMVTKVIRATLRAVRLLTNDKKYGLEVMKGPHIELGSDRDRFIERTYNAAVQSYSATGTVDEKLQREMIASAVERVKPKSAIAPDRVFDFSFARKAAEGLR